MHYLFDKASQFEKLCTASFNRLSWDPTMPLPYGIQELGHFALDLMTFDLEQNPGVSVDVEEIKKAGGTLYDAFKEMQQHPQDNQKISNVIKNLQNILGLTRDGGGSLYNKAQKLIEQFRKLNNVKPVAHKPRTDFLDQYMAQENAKEQANNYMANMQSSLSEPPATSDALKRNPFMPELENTR